MSNQSYKYGIVMLLLTNACVEPFDASSDILSDTSMVDALIVEANITSMEARQKVFLSRMQRVESDSTVNLEEERLFNTQTPIIIERGLRPKFENGANVEIRAEDGTTYRFEESQEGTYESVVSFAAVPEISYQLFIVTANGEEFISEQMKLPQTSSIDSIYAELMVSDSGVDGVGIFVDSSFQTDENKLLRYTYEETYKIIAPRWTPYEFEIVRDETEVIDYSNGETEILYPDVRLVPRAREEQVCYRTDFSNVEVLLNANILNGNRAERNMVRFIGATNPIISHRYSILVKQRVVSKSAFDFYSRLTAFSQNESLFSQVQPGSLEGNVFSVDNNVPVVGFFDVSSEVSQRLYFNFEDLFPNEPLPPYFGTVNCESPVSPILGNPERDGPYPPPPENCPQPLIDRIKLGLVEYYQDNVDPPGLCEGPYLVVPTICGDCNLVGSNIKPDFWVD